MTMDTKQCVNYVQRHGLHTWISEGEMRLTANSTERGMGASTCPTLVTDNKGREVRDSSYSTAVNAWKDRYGSEPEPAEAKPMSLVEKWADKYNQESAAAVEAMVASKKGVDIRTFIQFAVDEATENVCGQRDKLRKQLDLLYVEIRDVANMLRAIDKCEKPETVKVEPMNFVKGWNDVIQKGSIDQAAIDRVLEHGQPIMAKIAAELTNTRKQRDELLLVLKDVQGDLRYGRIMLNNNQPADFRAIITNIIDRAIANCEEE